MEVVVTAGATSCVKLHPVKSSLLTNQHPTFYRPEALHVAQPSSIEGKILCKITLQNLKVLSTKCYS